MKTKKLFINVALIILSSLLIFSACFVTIRLVKNNSEEASALVLSENKEITKKIAHEGMILLKNDGNCLPLKSSMNVVGYGGLAEAVYTTGENTGTGTPTQVKLSDGYVFGGGGSGWVSSTGTISPKEGLENAVKKGQIASFTHYMTSADKGEFDRAIYIIVRTAAEDADLIESDFYLTDGEKNEIDNLINHYGKEKVCVLLNTPNVIDTSYLLEKDVGAILQTWLAGQEAGNAIADILTGQVSPSGKTTDTWAKSLDDYVTTKEYTNPIRIRYEEDLYIGYRWFETFDPNYNRVNFEFGYGLSYTTFDVKVTAVKMKDKEANFYVTVTNTGDTYSGKEVVQIYYQTPNDVIDAPAKQLIAYDKTATLAPGASENMVLTVNINDMASFDDTGVIAKNAYVLQAGKYNFYVGNSIKNAGKKGVVAYYTQGANEVTEQLSELEYLQTSLDRRLTSDGTYEILNDYNTGSVETHYVNKGGATIIDAPDIYSSRDDYYQNANLRAWWYNNYGCWSYFTGYTMNQIVRHLNNEGRQIPLRYKLYVADISHAYNLELFVTNEYGYCADLFDISVDYTFDDVDNGVATGFTVACDQTADWKTANRVVAGQIEFAKTGYCLLTIKAKANCGLDYICLYDNTVAPDEKSEIVAEAYADKTNEGNVVTEELGITGYCVGNLQNGNFVEYNVYANAGAYWLSLNLSSVIQAIENYADVYVNGTKAGTISTKRTGAHPFDGATSDNWWSYKETPAIKVNLVNGENKIKLQIVGTTSRGNETHTNLNKLIFRPESMGKPNITYSDNTSDYEWISSTESPYSALDRVYTYTDVIQGNISALDYVKQFNVWELATLGITCFYKNETNSNVGGFGGIAEGPYTDNATDPNFPDSLNNYTTGVTTKYGLPYGNFSDGPAGTRFGDTSTNVPEKYRYSTYFPCMTMLASSWNDDLAFEFGVAYGKEAAGVGVSVSLMPGVNIHRNPLCGRNFEYFAEDPYITGWMAANVIKGVQSAGAGTSIKHFAMNNQETGRFFSDTRVSVRAMREIYLEGFRIAITNSNPTTVMSCYNQINGTPGASNYDLLTTILRDEWGFEGIVESDWGEWHYDTTTGIKNGGNIRSFGYSPLYLQQIVTAYQQHYITYDELANNAAQVVNMMVKTNAQAIGNSRLQGNGVTTVNATSYLTCGDGSNKQWNYLYHSYVNAIGENGGVVESKNTTGIFGTAKLETNGYDTYLSNLNENSGAYYTLFVEKAGDYYLSYLINIQGYEGQYGNFKIVIDGNVVDTFTNPNKIKTANDWYGVDYMTGDGGAKKITLSAGLHRMFVDSNGSYYNIHNFVFSKEAPSSVVATGNGNTQTVTKENGTIVATEYTLKTGTIKKERTWLTNPNPGDGASYNASVVYAFNVVDEGKYGLQYNLNIGGTTWSFGNFDVYIDSVKVDDFTNVKHTTNASAGDYTSFALYTGDDGLKTTYLSKGIHVLQLNVKISDFNIGDIVLKYIEEEDFSFEQLIESDDLKKVDGAGLWVSVSGNGGLRYKVTLPKTATAKTVVKAVLVPTTVNMESVTLDNYSSFGGRMVEASSSIKGDTATYVAEFKDIKQADFKKDFVAKFFVISTENGMSVQKTIVSDARNCYDVANALLAKGTYSQQQLSVYLK